jgi:dephospho-CoA kinase
VGLTGGIASGKSTVSRLLSTKHKFPIVDADVIARDVVQSGTAAYARIVKQFGEDIILRDGSLHHPAVRWAMLSAVMKLWIHGESVFILDVPLLVEANLWKMVGWVVVVYCETN